MEKLYGRLLAAYVIMVGVGLVGLVLVAMIPRQMIEEQVRESLTVMQEEGVYPTVGLVIRPVVVDNYTDALMLNLAYSMDSERPLWSVLTNPRILADRDELNQLVHLEAALDGEGEIEGYERYWHGHLLWLRPLLLMMSYQQIRWLMLLILMVTAGALLWLVYKRFGLWQAGALLLGLLMVDILFVWQSLQFVGVFLVGMLVAISYLLLESKKVDPYLVLFVGGGLTAMFDLLTAPLVVLGMVLVVVRLVDPDVPVWKLAVVWGVGYLLICATKWVLVGLVFAPSAIETAYDQVVNRTVTQADAEFSYLRAVVLNVKQLIGYHKVSKLIVLVVGVAGLMGLWSYGSYTKNKLQQIWPWALIALMPFGWYLVAANHSYLHVWYTYRGLWMSVVGVGVIWGMLMDWDRLSEDLSKLKKRFS